MNKEDRSYLVRSIFQDILRLGYIEDRLEYTAEDLATAYPHLDASGISCLKNLIKQWNET